MNNRKKIVYIDLDDTLADYSKAYKEVKTKNPEIEFPQSISEFFLNLELKEKETKKYLEKLSDYYDIWFLTAPSYMNPLSYTEKRLWIEKHFGISWCKKLIFCVNKSLLKGNYLIDDSVTKRQLEFEGELILLGSEKFSNFRYIFDYLYYEI